MPNLVFVMPQEPLQEPENMSCKDSLVKWLWVTFGHSEHLDTWKIVIMNNASNNCLALVAFSSAVIYSDMVCKKFI